jgi:uncharacterized protein (DUF433 family)
MKSPNIIRNPEILDGTPTFKGTRVPVRVLIESFEAGDSLDDFLENFPSVSRNQAIEVLELAMESITNDEATA